MEKEGSTGQKTDVVKLFLVLMALSAVGFGVGAAYLYHQQTTYAQAVEEEKRVLGYIKRLAETQENKAFWGPEPADHSVTTGDKLPAYLEKKAKYNAIPPADRTAQAKRLHPRDGYSETKVTSTFSNLTLEQIVRYLYNVQVGKNDVFITSLALRKFNYDELIATCSATVEVVVFEEAKEQPKKK